MGKARMNADRPRLADHERDELLYQCQAVIDQAYEIWGRVKPIYEGHTVDSKRVDHVVGAIQRLAGLHRDYDKWKRR